MHFDEIGEEDQREDAVINVKGEIEIAAKERYDQENAIGVIAL
jgi:hypothetical protein